MPQKMKFKSDLIMRFPHRLYRKLTHKHTRYIYMLLLIVILSLPLFLLYKEKHFENSSESDYQDIINEVQNFIDREMTKCLMLKKRSDQNKAFRNIKTSLPIIPLRMTLTTSVFLFDDGKKQFIMKRIILTKDNKSQEEAISLNVSHKNIVETMFSETKTFKFRRESYRILWLFIEYLEEPISLKTVNRDQDRIRIILTDICEAIKYLHDRNIIHLDLKISNVMGTMENNKHVYKLIDFGFARDLSRDQLTKDNFAYLHKKAYGTFPYKAPEVVLRNKHGKASDIWCIGIMAWFMSRNYIGFRTKSGEKDIKMFRKHLESRNKINIPNYVDANLRSFILFATEFDETERPSIDQLIEHPFIKTGLALQNTQELNIISENANNSTNENIPNNEATVS